jgi:two-component system sensor histidine kinase TctE
MNIVRAAGDILCGDRSEHATAKCAIRKLGIVDQSLQLIAQLCVNIARFFDPQLQRNVALVRMDSSVPVAEQIRRRHADDLEPLPTDVPLEVVPLTAALNRLFAELDEAQSAQQRFIADAAHQLRTPLATLQVQAERALRERDPAAGTDAVGSVLTATQRLGHLVHQLLTLARVEPAGATRILADCDLAALARETTAHWVPAALEGDTDLGYAGPASGIVVPGDPLLLRELLNNLLDNALKYAHAPSRECHVTVGVEDGASPCLWVEDDGPGIPAEAREYVLERFSRLPGNGAAGSGLGLAIVREIAARHGATVVVGAAAGDAGTRIAVNFAAPDGGSAAKPMVPAADH